MHASHRWENRPAESMDFSDLDHQEISRTIDEAIRRQRMDDPGTRDPRDLLLGLGLIQDGRLLNAGWSHGDVSTDVSNVSNDVSNNVSKIFLGEAPGGPDSSPDETRRAVGAGDLQSGASRASSIFLGAGWPNAQGRAIESISTRVPMPSTSGSATPRSSSRRRCTPGSCWTSTRTIGSWASRS